MRSRFLITLLITMLCLARAPKFRDIFVSLDLSNEDFDAADTYLLQKKYVDGTLGGMDGSRYLQSSGIDFYENNSSLLNDTLVKQGNGSMPDAKKVFVVHGRDGRLRDDFFAFLRALDLDPIEWSEALKLTGKASPYIGEALESAFKNAQAVIVLLSPDDEVRLSPELWKEAEEENEKIFKLQARPNVLFEAGMAFGTHPDRTLLIEVGHVKAFSDVAGRHVIRISNSAGKRNEIAERLRTIGCDVITSGNDWLNTGDFNINRESKAEDRFSQLEGKQLRKPVIACYIDENELNKCTIRIKAEDTSVKKIVLKNIGDGTADYTKLNLYLDYEIENSYVIFKLTHFKMSKFIRNEKPNVKLLFVSNNNDIRETRIPAKDELSFDFSLQNNHLIKKDIFVNAILKVFYGEPNPLEIPFTIEIKK